MLKTSVNTTANFSLHCKCTAVTKGSCFLQETVRPLPCWQADQRLERLPEDQCSNMLNSQAYEDKEITLMQLYPEGMLDDMFSCFLCVCSAFYYYFNNVVM